MRSLIEGLLKLIRRPEIRYLITGGANTALSFGVGALLFYLLIDHLHYVVIMVLGTVVNITISYVNYKFIVFKTKGNYIREYLRFYMIYSLPIAFNFIAFPICYQVLKINPYITQLILTAITVVFSYFGHKNFSFLPKKQTPPASPLEGKIKA